MGVFAFAVMVLSRTCSVGLMLSPQSLAPS